MSSYCEYEMHVAASSRQDIERLVEIMVDYEQPRHFWRVVCADNETWALPDGTWAARIAGHCSWSVHACMGTGRYSYSRDHPEQSISLQQASDLLGIRVEVYSKMLGCGSQEHYLFDKGEQLVAARAEYIEFRYNGEDDWQEWKSRTGLEISKEDLDERGIYTVGGFERIWSA